MSEDVKMSDMTSEQLSELELKAMQEQENTQESAPVEPVDTATEPETETVVDDYSADEAVIKALQAETKEVKEASSPQQDAGMRKQLDGMESVLKQIKDGYSRMREETSNNMSRIQAGDYDALEFDAPAGEVVADGAVDEADRIKRMVDEGVEVALAPQREAVRVEKVLDDVRDLQQGFGVFQTSADVGIIEKDVQHPEFAKVQKMIEVKRFRDTQMPNSSLRDAYGYLKYQASISSPKTPSSVSAAEQVIADIKRSEDLPHTLGDAGASGEARVDINNINTGDLANMSASQLRELEATAVADEDAYFDETQGY